MNRFDPDSLVSLLVLGLILLALYWRPRWKPSTDAHGTAAWSDDATLGRAGMFRPGLVIGRSIASGGLISLPKDNVHTAVFAPPGTGKSVLATTWLLSYSRGSCIVLDVKGELFRNSQQFRRTLGPVYRLDPFGVCGPGDSWNPLSLVESGPDLVSDVRPLAEALVVRGEEKESHWNDQSANVLTGLIAAVCLKCSGAARSLDSVRELLTAPGAFENTGLKLIEQGGVFARVGGVMAALKDKERDGVISTANRHTTFLDSLAILNATTESTFDMRQVLEGNATVYLVLPPHQLEAQSRWLRLVIASIIRLIGKEGMRNGRECLMVLDEAGTAIGHMPAIETGLCLLRSAGLRMATFWQSATQLKSVFKEREGIIYDNCDAQIYFGTNSLETAERVAKQLGTFTATSESFNSSEQRSWQEDRMGEPGTNVSRSSAVSVNVHARELLKPDEVLNLRPDAVIAFVRGVPPVLCKRVQWFREPPLVKRQKGGN